MVDFSEAQEEELADDECSIAFILALLLLGAEESHQARTAK